MQSMPRQHVFSGRVLRCSLCLLLLAGPVSTEAGQEADRDRLIDEVIVPLAHPGDALLRALRLTPRHVMLPDHLRHAAYRNQPLDIGSTVLPPPALIASMIELLDVRPEHRVLLVGAGTAYEGALLALLAKRVCIVESTAGETKRTAAILRRLGHQNAGVRQEYGMSVWAEEAPFDRVLLSAAAPELPPPLVEQLAKGGKLVAPIGPTSQVEIVVVQKQQDENLSWSFAGPAGLESPPLTRGK